MYLALCDDEPSQIARIVSILETYRAERLPSLRWSAFRSGFSLLSAIEHGEVFDAVLLDIFLADTNGMEAARSLREMNDGIDIVFLTSSADYAVESYRVDACDYLLKPVSRDRLFSVLGKLESRREKEKHQGVVVRSADGSFVKVLWKQLAYLEARGHNVMLHHADGSSTKTRTPFSSLAEELAGRENFAQTHRSFIVNLHYVHRIGKNQVVLLDGTELPLPRKRRQSVADSFQNLVFKEME